MTFSLLNHITAPLTAEELDSLADESGTVTVTVLADFGSLVSNDFETNLDWFSELVTGGVSLTDISFELTGADADGDALVKVTGTVDFSD